MGEGLGIPGNISIAAYRASIGLHHANKKFPTKISSIHLLCNAFYEIIRAYIFIALFMASILKNCCFLAFLSVDIFSPLVALLFSKKLFK